MSGINGSGRSKGTLLKGLGVSPRVACERLRNDSGTGVVAMQRDVGIPIVKEGGDPFLPDAARGRLVPRFVSRIVGHSRVRTPFLDPRPSRPDLQPIPDISRRTEVPGVCVAGVGPGSTHMTRTGRLTRRSWKKSLLQYGPPELRASTTSTTATHANDGHD